MPMLCSYIRMGGLRLLGLGRKHGRATRAVEEEDGRDRKRKVRTEDHERRRRRKLAKELLDKDDGVHLLMYGNNICL